MLLNGTGPMQAQLFLKSLSAVDLLERRGTLHTRRAIGAGAFLESESSNAMTVTCEQTWRAGPRLAAMWTGVMEALMMRARTAVSHTKRLFSTLTTVVGKPTTASSSLRGTLTGLCSMCTPCCKLVSRCLQNQGDHASSQARLAFSVALRTVS